MKKLALAFSFALLSSSVIAKPAVFYIDTNHTEPMFKYDHFGYSYQVHSFDKTSGKIVYDRAARTGSVNITIDSKSVNTGYALFNKLLQGPDYFDTAKYPTITFKSTKVKFKGNKPVAVDGNLTIKGITKPVTLTLTSFKEMPHPIMKKDAIGANAVTKIKRTEFNMGKYVPNVSDEITLLISVEAIQH